MIMRSVRSLLLAGASEALGMRGAKRIERRLAGGKALAVRAHIAHRAALASLFHEAKQQKQRHSGG